MQSGTWGTQPAESEIVLIGDRDGIHPDELQSVFDSSIGTGDESDSALLKLTNLLFGEEKNIGLSSKGTNNE